MNKNGQVGAIVLAFVGILVGVALFLTISQSIGVSTSTVDVANKSLGAIAVNGTAQYFTDYVNLDSIVIYNATGDALIPATNYSITNHFVYNGAEVVKIMPNYTASPIQNFSSIWKVSGTAEPQGYIGGAGRTVALIIPIFFALAIAVVALEPTLRNGFKELVGM
jgi:hypothetical protein